MTADKPKIVIVAAEFSKAIVDAMVEEARKQAVDDGAIIASIVRVPGCYELPLAIDLQLSKPDIDVVIALGFIERGETRHGEVMGHVVHQTLIDMQLKHRKPIGIGIIGPGATLEQAEKRKIDYARAAVRAALRSQQLIETTTSAGHPSLPT
jgi:6,7-dimethyl-8-ribityllumazine synthase